jgi:glutathione S-transferase
MLLCRYEGMVRPDALRWKAWTDDQWNRAWSGMARFEQRDDVLNGPFTIAQIGLVCVLGYADFRFADCGWRKAYPKLDSFNKKMLERPSVQISVPPAA